MMEPEERAWELFDAGLEIDDVIDQLDVEREDAESWFRAWEERAEEEAADGFREPEPEEPIDFDWPDDWAFRCSP